MNPSVGCGGDSTHVLRSLEFRDGLNFATLVGGGGGGGVRVCTHAWVFVCS